MNGFDIISKLGDGAYSVVYKVKRKEDGKIYALKKVKLQNLSPKEKENALNEVRILASVKSTFVISYKEAFIDENEQSLCIVMEFADKGDLYQKITQFKKMGCLIEETDVWRIFIQMIRGLKALHELKILHRDLKSANIFLFSDGSAKIGDLNVSKVAKKGLGYTQTGTPYYASPEVWNDKPYDSKSDIWSLGCVTYEMLTLRPPFRAENMEGLYNKVIKGQYNKVPDRYSNDIAEVIKLMLKVNPTERLSCAQILKHPLVQKRIEFFQATANMENINMDNMDEGELLKTIRIPKNILFLADKLPTANYETTKVTNTCNNNSNCCSGNATENMKIKAKTNNNYAFAPEELPEIKLPSQRMKIMNSNNNGSSNGNGNNVNNININININNNENINIQKAEIEREKENIKIMKLNDDKLKLVNNNIGKKLIDDNKINRQELILKNNNNIYNRNIKLLPNNLGLNGINGLNGHNDLKGLPSLNKIELNPISISGKNPLQKNLMIKKNNLKDFDKYIHEKYKIYAPHFNYVLNNKYNNPKNLKPKRLVEDKYYNIYMPKKNNNINNINSINNLYYNNYNRIIPNKKLNPIYLKK